MARTSHEGDRSAERRWNGLATAICALSFGVVLFLLVPDLASGGSIPTGDLILTVPFAVVAIFCFQLGLEGLAVDDGRSTRSRDRTRLE